MDCEEHVWETPFPQKHLERCRLCGIWRIHNEDVVIWLPPPEALAAARRHHVARGPGRVIRFARNLGFAQE